MATIPREAKYFAWRANCAGEQIALFQRKFYFRVSSGARTLTETLGAEDVTR